jgi:hypothetical protein
MLPSVAGRFNDALFRFRIFLFRSKALAVMGTLEHAKDFGVCLTKTTHFAGRPRKYEVVLKIGRK